MKSRSAQLRERNRRVFAWSLGVAALVHAGAFFISPAWRVEPLPESEERVRTSGAIQTVGTFVAASFGPPEIYAEDGSLRPEPPTRVLEADRVVQLPPDCAVLSRRGLGETHGRVQLRVDASGHADVVEVIDSTGEDCWDLTIETLADALWYRWLPDERFAAPVELIQPVTLAEVRD